MRFIAPVVTNDTRSMVVEAVVPNADGELLSGDVRHGGVGTRRNRSPASLCRLGAVEKTGEVARVFVVRDGVAREQVVALGEEEKGKVEIRSGLTGKEILVAQPELVHDGDTVSQMNQLAAICVKRPVFATVLILVLVVFGVFGYLEARARPLSRRSIFRSSR